MRKMFPAILGVVVCLALASCGRKRGASTQAGEDTAGEPKGARGREASTQAGKELVNSIGMKFRLIQPGSFMMGSEKGDGDEKPVHKVTLTKGFYIGVYEVTQEEWEKVMGSNPSRFKGTRNPVENVSWDDAQEFIRKVSEKEKVTYRLPTEAEWEYACRAGTTTEFYWGDDPDYRQIGEYAWWGDGSSDDRTHSVGQKKPNAWGLYDMSGNVWEWCQDRYGSYSSGSQTDPTGAAGGSYRVFRGGCWDILAIGCRSAFRFRRSPSLRIYFLGFRLVRAMTEISEGEYTAGAEVTPRHAVRAEARRYAIAFYYCMDCKKEFTANASEVPPTECPTCKQITGVLLRKYQCKKCNTVFAGYMQKYDPDTKRAIERRRQGEKVSDSQISNSLISGPDTEDWMDSSTQKALDFIANMRCPKCEASGADMEAIFPE